MRDIVDFYRRRPVLGTVLVLVALALSTAIAVVARTDNALLLIVFTAIMGIVLGAFIGARQRRE